MGDLTKNFSRAEFACHCGCGFDDINLGLVAQLQHSRDAVNLPFVITSGCRCPAWNAWNGGAKRSAHIRGEAVDIAIADFEVMYRMAFDLIRRFRRLEFGRKVEQGQVKMWIHVDVDDSLPSPRLVIL